MHISQGPLSPVSCCTLRFKAVGPIDGKTGATTEPTLTFTCTGTDTFATACTRLRFVTRQHRDHIFTTMSQHWTPQKGWCLSRLTVLGHKNQHALVAADPRLFKVNGMCTCHRTSMLSKNSRPVCVNTHPGLHLDIKRATLHAYVPLAWSSAPHSTVQHTCATPRHNQCGKTCHRMEHNSMCKRTGAPWTRPDGTCSKFCPDEIPRHQAWPGKKIVTK
jgi:hypothetical protein